MNDYFDILDAISVIIYRWENDLCPDCHAPIIDKHYFRRCSEKPKEHSLGDAIFYLKKIKKILDEF